MEEIWKDVVGCEGYQVSNFGRVKSLKYRNKCEERILKQTKNKVTGYYMVNICGKTRSVHRLVAQALIPNPHNLPQINHKDEDKTNNHVENLEWCDRKYNVNYGTSIQRAKQHRKILKGDDNPMWGKHLSEETKKKLRECNTGENNPNFGKSRSAETKERQSKAMLGHDVSEETRKKISDSLKGRHPSKETLEKRRKSLKEAWKRRKESMKSNDEVR